MDEFLAIVLSMPTVLFTVGLGAVVLYWISVMLGALDLDLFDPSSADGGVEGAAKGAAEGTLAGILEALRLRHAPVTVIGSLAVLLGWVGSYFGMRYLAPMLPVGGGVAALLVALAAMLVALPLTSLITRPLKPLFVSRVAPGNANLVGSVVTVRTGTVNEGFGQGELATEGLIVQVRAPKSAGLKRGDKALILGWDADQHAFEVEPMEAVLAEAKAEEEPVEVASEPEERGQRGRRA